MFVAASLSAAERKWDFSEMPLGKAPTNCSSSVACEGAPGTWKVQMDEFPLALQPVNSTAPKTAPKAVVAQVAKDYSDNHFPLLVLGNETYGDFTFKTHFKIVDGFTDQAAGFAFRIQDEKNFFYTCADAISNKVYFCGFKNGKHITLYSEDVPVPKGVWHELTVQCTEGTKVLISLDEKHLAVLSAPMFAAGKIAVCTKSDTLANFTDTRINYTPKELFVQSMVRDVMEQFPRLEGVEIFMAPPKEKEIRIVASNKESEIGKPGEKNDADVIERGVNYYHRDKENVYVTMPLRDRNGDPVAAVRIAMKSFPGQTEENAIVRAMPILKTMQTRAAAVESLY